MSHLHAKVSALVDDELSPRARRRALAHARRCGACRQEIAETLDVKRRLHRLAPVEVSEDLREVVARQCVVRTGSGNSQPPQRSSVVRWALVGVGSMSAGLAVLAYGLGAPPAQAAAAVRPPLEDLTADFAASASGQPLGGPPVLGDGGGPGAAATTTLERGRRDPWPGTTDGLRLSARAPRAVPVAGGVDPVAAEVLHRASHAARDMSFEGTWEVVARDGGQPATSYVGVRHAAGQGTTVDLLRSDGRSGSETFLPEDPAADSTLPFLWHSGYDVQVAGAARVAGRTATEVSVQRGREVVARLWVDTRTGLLLRRALYADGRLVRAGGYTWLREAADYMAHLPPEVATPPTTQVTVSVAATMTDRGLACPESLTDAFRRVSLTQLEPTSRAARSAGMVQATYTDGLSTLTVFETRGRLADGSEVGMRRTEMASSPAYVGSGMPTAVMWESGGTVYTALSDAPLPVVRDALKRLPHEQSDESDGVGDRLERGFSRMADAILP